MFPLRLVSVLFTVLLAAPGSVFVHGAEENATATADNDDEACVSETASINSDPAVQAALLDLKDTVLAAVEDDFYQFCSVFNRQCTVDLDDYSSALRSNCTAAGGQIATTRASLDCTGKVAGVPIPGGVEAVFVNIPACVGPSCDTAAAGSGSSSLPAAVEDNLEQVLEQVETVVESGLEDGNCTAAVGDTSNVASVTSLAAAAASTVALGLALSIW